MQYLLFGGRSITPRQAARKIQRLYGYLNKNALFEFQAINKLKSLNNMLLACEFSIMCSSCGGMRRTEPHEAAAEAGDEASLRVPPPRGQPLYNSRLIEFVLKPLENFFPLKINKRRIERSTVTTSGASIVPEYQPLNSERIRGGNIPHKMKSSFNDLLRSHLENPQDSSAVYILRGISSTNKISNKMENEVAVVLQVKSY